ncbi:DUF6510 family protein [Streptomyces flaveus]|uniref:Uncharacterized protein n=1 Tax=Streptomyces flaveus TaxID=66370 RepID=A0A917QDE5_9ACTN|nr:DUF6510 family protein [Streptomyces flaveus]GGK44834.1 hypothetical protein GCM10010094_00680 [Streptomyces flaveus]
MDRQDTTDYEDGNALAGPLGELFTADVTAAAGRCAGCGHTALVADLRVYTHAPGLVARCPNCDAVILRLLRAPDAAWLDLRGTVYMRVPLPPA